MPAPMLRSVVFISFCLGHVACAEEAIVRPPAPPNVPVKELGAAPARPASEPASAAASEPVAPAKKMTTLVDFMEDVIEPEMKKAMKAMKAKGRSSTLDALLRQVSNMAPEDPKYRPENPAKTWDGIVEAALKTPKYGQSCKQCHALYKKPYKKAFRKREVEVE